MNATTVVAHPAERVARPSEQALLDAWRQLVEANTEQATRLRETAVSNDPGEQVERILPYIEQGFTHLISHAPGPDQERWLRLYAKDVLPRLRAL